MTLAIIVATISMEYIFDIKKNIENITKHGVSFEAVEFLDWEIALTRPDIRFNYGEDRFVTYAFLNKRLHTLVWTERNETVRVISFRKANKREQKIYEKI